MKCTYLGYSVIQALKAKKGSTIEPIRELSWQAKKKCIKSSGVEYKLLELRRSDIHLVTGWVITPSDTAWKMWLFQVPIYADSVKETTHHNMCECTAICRILGYEVFGEHFIAPNTVWSFEPKRVAGFIRIELSLMNLYMIDFSKSRNTAGIFQLCVSLYLYSPQNFFVDDGV